MLCRSPACCQYWSDCLWMSAQPKRTRRSAAAAAATVAEPSFNADNDVQVTRPLTSPEQRNISWNEIKVVQNLIERCLQQYMSQTEIITALQTQANIEPGFTCLVWQKLEEQNRDFFKAYSIRLRLKDHIVAFNYLVRRWYLLFAPSKGLLVCIYFCVWIFRLNNSCSFIQD